MSSTPVSVVTGANSGIGRATALHLAANGHRVYGTVRDTAKATKLLAAAEATNVEVHLITMDTGDDTSVADGFADVLSAEGRIDNIVNNAGISPIATTEESTPGQHLEVINVNVCGPLRAIKAALPGMRERGSGCIVNVSSAIGRVASIAQSPYLTSKWALEGMSESLAQEVAPFGVRVAIIEPGVTRTAIFAKNVEAPNTTGAYEAHYRRMFQFFAAGIAQATPAEEVAAVILRAITTDAPQLRYPVSWGAFEMLLGRKQMTDEDWVALGALTEDADYYAAYERYFGLHLS